MCQKTTVGLFIFTGFSYIYYFEDFFFPSSFLFSNFRGVAMFLFSVIYQHDPLERKSGRVWSDSCAGPTQNSFKPRVSEEIKAKNCKGVEKHFSCK